MNSQEAKQLLKKYSDGGCNETEVALIESWFLKTKEDQPANDLPFSELQADVDEVYGNLQLNYLPKRIKLWPRLAAAASILLCLTIGGYFLLHKTPPTPMAFNQINDIAPGGNKAILTLANGTKINLNNAANGKVASQGNTSVLKLANGQLTYSKTTSNQTYQVLYNTVTTPRGGQYHLTLADGTYVILNASSSITYPTTFTGSKREVTITGEAYFEVTKNKHLPFLVKSGEQTVQVLGTHFNINAYTDEEGIKTTLLEGSIKVSNAASTQMIKPGEQALFKNNVFDIKHVDVENEVAWKNGFFQFKNADIKTVIRQLSRWYDVDISYTGDMTDKSITGKIYRNVSALQVLQILSYLKINSKIEQGHAGKRIIVTP